MVNFGRISGVSAITASSISIIGILLSSAYAQNWSWPASSLSALGDYNSQCCSAYLFNITLIVSGMLAVVFAAGLFKNLRDHTRRIGTTLLVVAATFLILVGIFPLSHDLHTLVSIGYFVSSPSAAIVIGWGLLKQGFHSMWKIVIGLGMIISGSHISIVAVPWMGIAIPEYIGAVSAALWIGYVGINLVRKGTLVNFVR